MKFSGAWYLVFGVWCLVIGIADNGANYEQPTTNCQIRSLLTVRTIMTAATCDDNPFDGRSAHQARLALTAVHAMLQLKEAFAPFGVNVIAHRRAAQFNGFAQHLLYGSVQLAQLGARER